MIDLGEIGRLQALSLLNFLLALLLSWFSTKLSSRMRGKSFSFTLSLLSIAFLIFAAHQAAIVLSPTRLLRWDVIISLSDTLFMLVLFYGLLKLGESLRAYQHIIRRKK